MPNDSWKLILRRGKEIFLPTLFLLITLFLGWKFLLPKMTQISKFHQQLKKDEAQVVDLEKKAAFLEKQKNEGLFDSFEKVEKVLPGEKDVAGLLVSIEGLKESTNLGFETLDFKVGLLASGEAELKKQSQKELEFKITILGSFEKLISFLDKIENTAPLTAVKNAKVDFRSGKANVRANLSLIAYHLPLEKEKIVVEQPLPQLSSLQQTLSKLLKFEVFTYTTFLPEEMVGKENPFSP